MHGVADKASVEDTAWQQLQFLCGLAPEAFAE